MNINNDDEKKSLRMLCVSFSHHGNSLFLIQTSDYSQKIKIVVWNGGKDITNFKKARKHFEGFRDSLNSVLTLYLYRFKDSWR